MDNKTCDKKKERCWPYILIIFIFHLLNNLIILKQDSVPLYFDEGGFYNLSVTYYRYLFSTPQISTFLRYFYSISRFYPPLIFIERMPFYALWGVSGDVSVLANLPFLLILICFTFLIGRYIADAKTGLLAAFLISFYPTVYGFSRTNFVTIPLAAIVAVSLYLLLRTESFTNTGRSVLLGASIGLGLLVKWLYVIYIFPAMLFLVLASFRRQKQIRLSRVVINLLLSAATAIAIALPWYLPNIKSLIPMLFNASYDNPNWLNFAGYFKENPFRLGLFSYVMIMERYQLYTYYTILFIFSLFRYISSKNSNTKWVFLISLVIPYIIFSFAVTEYYSGELCPRYIVPLYVLVAIITAKGIMEVKRGILRKALLAFIVLAGLTQFYWVSYNNNMNRNTFTQHDFQRRTTRGLLSARAVDWKVDEIITTIRRNRIANKDNILIIPHTPLTSALSYKLELNKESNIIFPLNATFVGEAYKAHPAGQYKASVDLANFVLTQEGGNLIYDDSGWLKDSIAALSEAFQEQKSAFSLLKELQVDIDEKGAKILIYRRNNKAVNTAGSSEIKEPEGEGFLISAVDFKNGNLEYNSGFGLLIDGGKSPPYAIYEVSLPSDGNYELWVRYATQEFRPVDIYFDGVLKKSEALTKFTAGWGYNDSRWSKEAEIAAKKGRHTLKFIAPKSLFPHIDSIKMLYKPK